MKRTMAALAACVLCLFLAPLSRGEDPQAEIKALTGVWLPTSAELAGQKLPAEFVQGMKLVLEGEKYTLTTAQGADRGTLKTNGGPNPKEMDIQGVEGPNRGKTFLAIYERNGDALTICYDLSGKDRPKEFKTKAESKLFLVVYRREKP